MGTWMIYRTPHARSTHFCRDVLEALDRAIARAKLMAEDGIPITRHGARHWSDGVEQGGHEIRVVTGPAWKARAVERAMETLLTPAPYPAALHNGAAITEENPHAHH
jgi:hypothetical protein